MRLRPPTVFHSRILPILSILFLLMTFSLYFIPPAYAVNPTFDKASNTTSTNAATISPTITPTITGEFIVITVGIYDNLLASPPWTTTVADGATSLTLASALELDANTKNGAGLNRSLYEAVFYGYTPDTTLETWVVTLNQHDAGESAQASIALFNNAPSPLAITAQSNAGNSQCGAFTANCNSVSPQIGPAVSFSSAAILIGIVGQTSGATVGIGFTAPSTGCGIGNPYCSEYRVPGAAGNTNFPMGCVVTCYQWNEEGVVFDFGATGSTTITVGSCPTKNTSTFTMVNQTMYMYEGTSLPNEAVTTVQVNVASVGGSTGTHTVQLVIYATPNAGSISVSNLFTLVYSHQVALTSGSKNQQIVLAVSGVSFATAGSTWGIGVIGDNKVALNQSSLGGAFSFAGTPVSTATQNAFYTTQGSAFGTDLALCANAAYQNIVTSTMTITQAATTSVTTTITSTINTINAQVLFANNQNWPEIFLLLFLPAGIFLGVTRNLSGGLVGLLIGSVICLMAGVIPAYIFTGLLIGIVAMMVVVQRAGANG